MNVLLHIWNASTFKTEEQLLYLIIIKNKVYFVIKWYSIDNIFVVFLNSRV